MADVAPTPVNLQAPGKRLWAAVSGKYVLTPTELLILEEAARTADELGRLQRALRALRAADLVVEGYMGQPRAHPLLDEVRRHRALLNKLTASLNLPDELEEFGLRGPSRHARTAAKARWKGGGRRGMHRRPVDLVPERLRSYDRTEWAQPGDTGWWPAFQRWKDARAAWVAAHPGSQALGNGVERMRAEYQAQFSPEHYPPNGEAWG